MYNLKTDYKVMRRVINTTILSLLILIGVKSTAQNTPLTSIPFDMGADGRICLWCKVNQSDSLYFLLDTGASDMVINSTRLDKVEMLFDGSVSNLGTTGSGDIARSSSNDFTLGSIKHQETPFISIPYPNERFDGVLGLSVLRMYTVEINYDTKMVYLYDKESYTSDNPHRSKLEFRHSVPFTRVTIKSGEKELHPIVEIDTGSDRALDLSTPFVKEHSLATHFNPPYAISTVYGSDGASGNINNVYFDSLELGSYTLYKIPGGWSELEFGMLNSQGCDGMMGNNLLKRFNIVLDFKNDYIYWTPNNYLYTPFYQFLVN